MKYEKIARRTVTGLMLGVVCTLVASFGAPSAVAGPTTPLKLKVATTSHSIAYFPLFVAIKKGYFTQEGLDIGSRFPILGTGAKVAAAVQSGSVEVGGINGTDVFNIYRVNKGARAIALTVQAYYVDIVTGPHFKGPPITAPLNARIKALKGLKIGITGPGSGTNALVTYLLHRVGLNDSDVTLVSLGSNSIGALGALKSGRVDAISYAQPFAQQAEATGDGAVYISPARGDIPDLSHPMHGLFLTTKAVIDAKPKAVNAFIRGIGKAEAFVHEHPKAAKKLFLEYRSGMNEKTAAKVIPVLMKEMPKTPFISKSAYEQEVQFHITAGIIKSAPPYGAVVYNPPGMH